MGLSINRLWKVFRAHCGSLRPGHAANFASVLLVIGWANLAYAQSAGTPQATDLQVTGDLSSTSFDVEMTSGVVAEVFTLANPYRVIIDLPELTFHLKPGTGTSGGGLISAFRYGQFAERKARVVIDTTGPVKIASAKMLRAAGASNVSLKVVLQPIDAGTFGSGTGSNQSYIAKSPVSAAASDSPTAAVPAPVPAPSLPPADAVAAPGKKRGKPVVVIDPGHGGIDPGAISALSVPEKTVVLAVALQLKAALLQSGAYTVKMTRSTDVFVSLDRRLKFSEDNGADLFISLHADSIEETGLAETVRGATIYTLSERASDEQARIMADKENSSDLIAGLEAGSSSAKDQVKSILIDLMKRETSNFSADFSNVLAKRLGKATELSRDPQRSAAFKVLKQAHAPSVLVELGYLSNSKDQQHLTAVEWQKKVAGSIATAVQAYFGKRTAEQP